MSPKNLHKSLKRQAHKKGLRGKEADKFVFGRMDEIKKQKKP